MNPMKTRTIFSGIWQARHGDKRRPYGPAAIGKWHFIVIALLALAPAAALRAATHSADSAAFVLDLRAGFTNQTVAIPNSAPTKVLSGTLGSTPLNGRVIIDLAGAGLDSAKDYVLEFVVEPRTTSVVASRPDGSFGSFLQTNNAALLTQLVLPAAERELTVDLPNRWLVPLKAKGQTSVALDQSVEVNWLEAVVRARSQIEGFALASMAKFETTDSLLTTGAGVQRLQRRAATTWNFAEWPAAGYTVRVYERGGDGMPLGAPKASGRMWLGRLKSISTSTPATIQPPLVLLHGFASDARFFAGPDPDRSNSDQAFLAGKLAVGRPTYTLEVPNAGDIRESKGLLGLALAVTTEAHG
jgi:hypothetical protein